MAIQPYELLSHTLTARLPQYSNIWSCHYPLSECSCCAEEKLDKVDLTNGVEGRREYYVEGAGKSHKLLWNNNQMQYNLTMQDVFQDDWIAQQGDAKASWRLQLLLSFFFFFFVSGTQSYLPSCPVSVMVGKPLSGTLTCTPVCPVFFFPAGELWGFPEFSPLFSRFRCQNQNWAPGQEFHYCNF